MQSILNPPMAADGFGVDLRLRRPTADVVATRFRCRFPQFLPLAVHERDRLQVLPQLLVADPCRIQYRVDGMLFLAPVTLVAFLVKTPVQTREVRIEGLAETVLEILEQV